MITHFMQFYDDDDDAYDDDNYDYNDDDDGADYDKPYCASYSQH